MSKIDRTGAGVPKTGGTPESTESPEVNAPSNETQTESAAITPKSTAVDKSAAGDLKAAGDFRKTQLQSELQTKIQDQNKGLDPASQKEMELKLAQNMQRFAPPYVPVGPVVMGDNIAAPGHTMAGEVNELNLKADQFQINDQGNLVITNPKLIEFFKSLKAEGQDVHLGIMKLKPSGEE